MIAPTYGAERMQPMEPTPDMGGTALTGRNENRPFRRRTRHRRRLHFHRNIKHPEDYYKGEPNSPNVASQLPPRSVSSSTMQTEPPRYTPLPMPTHESTAVQTDPLVGEDRLSNVDPLDRLDGEWVPHFILRYLQTFLHSVTLPPSPYANHLPGYHSPPTWPKFHPQQPRTTPPKRRLENFIQSIPPARRKSRTTLSHPPPVRF